MLACEALGSVGQGPSCPGLLFDATRLSGHTRVPKRCCFPRPLKLDIACVIWGVWESRPPKVCLMERTSLCVKTPKASGNQPTMFSTPGTLPGLKRELRRETLAELRAGWKGELQFPLRDCGCLWAAGLGWQDGDADLGDLSQPGLARGHLWPSCLLSQHHQGAAEGPRVS